MTRPSATERRKHPRCLFKTLPRSVLKIDRQEFDVLDVSRNGLHIAGGNQYPLSGWVIGILCITGRGPIDIDAIVAWRQDGEMGLRLLDPISV